MNKLNFLAENPVWFNGYQNEANKLYELMAMYTFYYQE